MKVVYDAANIIDAHLVRHALEAGDIPVFLKGEALVGGMGELPMFGLVQVCVPEVVWPQAREIVEALALGAPTAADTDWRDDMPPVGATSPKGTSFGA